MKVLLANGQGFLSKPRGALAGYRLTGPDIGGVPVYLATLTRALREQGCQIVNLHFGEPNERASRQDGEYVLPSRGRRVGLRALGQLRDIIAQEQPDIVHLHCVYYALSPLMLEALRKWLPVVLTMHDVSAICYWRTKIMRNGECCTSPVGARCLTSGCYSLAADGRRLS